MVELIARSSKQPYGHLDENHTDAHARYCCSGVPSLWRQCSHGTQWPVGADDGGEVVVLIGGAEDRGRGHDLILVDPLPPAAGMEKICLERKLAMEREGELVGRHEWHNPDHEVLRS